jgi:ribosome maturation factor RimP
MDEIRDVLLKELEGIADSLDLHVVELTVFAGKRGLNIRAVLYREGGTTIQDCERATRLFNDRITILEPIDENNYTLQVSSPGLDRVFKDVKEYNIFQSRHVKIILRSPIEGSEGNVIRGVLAGLEGERVTLETEGDPTKSISIPMNLIKKTQLDG